MTIDSARYPLLVLLLAALSCRDGYGPPAAVASVELSASSVTLSPLGAQTLTAVPRAADGAPVSGRSVTWTSNDPLIATVSTAGVVTGVALGVTSVVAMVDGRTAEASVRVIATQPQHLAGHWRMHSFDDNVLPAAYAVLFDEPVGDEIIARVEMRLDSAKMELRGDGVYPFRQYCFTELHDDVPKYRYCWGDHGRFVLGSPQGRVAFTSEYIQNLFADGDVTVVGELALTEPLWTQEEPRATIWRRQ